MTRDYIELWFSFKPPQKLQNTHLSDRLPMPLYKLHTALGRLLMELEINCGYAAGDNFSGVAQRGIYTVAAMDKGNGAELLDCPVGRN